MAGCLVTEEIDFEEENVPPRIVNDPAGVTPINHIIEIDREISDDVRFSFLIEDDNIGQRWEVMWRASYVTAEGQADETGTAFGYIPTLPDRARFEISLNTLSRVRTASCVRLEVRVSSGFAPGSAHEDPIPIIDGDIAYAIWIVLLVDSDTAANLASCPTHKVRPLP